MKKKGNVCTCMAIIGLMLPNSIIASPRPTKSQQQKPFHSQNNPLNAAPKPTETALSLATETTVSTPKPQEVTVLGQNIKAKIGAWLTLIATALLGTTIVYKTCDGFFEDLLARIPFLKAYQASTARAAALGVTVPASTIGLMKFGPVVWYGAYMLYAGERVSPLLARSVLHDIQVYVQHLNTVKSVEKELRAAIDQINQMVQSAPIEHAPASVEVEDIPGQSKMMLPRGLYIDPALLDQMHVLIVQDEARIQDILEQLAAYLPPEEIAAFSQNIDLRKPGAYSIANELLEQAQALIERLKLFNNDLGDDAQVLSSLIRELIGYWQNYTQGLADSIDVDLRFCNHIHLLEQFIVNWLDRSLLCV